MRSYYWLALCAVGLFAALGACAPLQADAEEPRSAADDSDSSKKDKDGYLSMTDRRMATCLVMDSQAEIGLAKFVATHAEDEAVRAYAQKLADDYYVFVGLMSKATGGKAEAGIPKSDEDASNISTGGGSLGKLLNADKTVMRMKRDFALEGARLVKSQLQARSGADFDVYYLTYSRFRQLDSMNMLIVLQRYSSPALTPVITVAIEDIQSRLKQTDAILAKLGPSRPAVPRIEAAAAK